MAFQKKEVPENPGADDSTAVGVSTEPGGSVMDKLAHPENDANAGGTRPEAAEVDMEALEADAPELTREPQQVKEKEVIYMPRKDFSARINQNEFQFRKGVRTRITRDVANMLLEDEDRGYVQD